MAHINIYIDRYINIINSTYMEGCPDAFIENDMKKRKPGTTNIYSVLKEDRICGLYEVVYAAKLSRGYPVVQIQEILVFPGQDKKLPSLSKNCYYNMGGMAAGLHVYGWDRKGIKASWYHGAMEYSSDTLYESDITSSMIHRLELFTLEDIIAMDPALKYCAYVPNNGYIRLPEYIDVYRKHSIAEMFMKLGLYWMISSKNLEKIKGNRTFLKWLFKWQKSIQKKRISFTHAYNSFKKNPECDPADYCSSLKYRIECGKKLAQGNRKIYSEVIRYTTQEKLVGWLDDNRIGSATYLDYIEAALWLKLDLSDTKNLFPRNFNELHDEYCGQYARYKEEERIKAVQVEAEKERNRQKLLCDMMRKTAERAEFLQMELNGYCVMVAKDKGDLIEEGAAMENCVGKMSYDRRQADGESVICFIRRIEDPGTSYITAEVQLKGGLKIKQFYGRKNKVVPEMEWFKEEWMKAAKTKRRQSRQKKGA